MILKLLQRTAERLAKAERSGAFWASEAPECPRKVLLKRAQPELFLAPDLPQLVRQRLGFAAEAALTELLALALPDTNRRTCLEALLASHLREDLARAMEAGKLWRDQVHPWGIAQLPFVRTLAGVEVHGRPDYIVLLFDELWVLELKHPGIGRSLAPSPGALLQAGYYAQALELPARLLLLRADGQSAEHELRPQGGDVVHAGAELRFSGLSPLEFVARRLALLREARAEDFPIVEKEPGVLGPHLPPELPTHPDDRYQIVVNARGRPAARAQRAGEVRRSFRCHLCPARRICYPGLPWEKEEKEEEE